MMVEVSKAQEDEVGDGTTTAVVIGGELLKKAEELVDQNIHPTVVARGYRMANDRAQKILNDLGEKVDIKDKKVLQQIAMTAMTGKSAERARDSLATLAVEAVSLVADETLEGFIVDTDNIKVEKRQGGSIDDTKLIMGVVLDKEKVHPGMPDRVEKAKIALVDSALEIKKAENDAEIRITDPNQLQAFLDQEEGMLKKMVENIKKSGANVVFCQKGIDDLAQHFLSKEGILAARRVKKSDMEKLARATGGKVVTSLEDLSSADLGTAGNVEAKKISGDDMIFVTGCKSPKAVSILVRGGTEHVIDEVERSLEDALGGVSSAIELGKVVAGGGAIEMEVVKQLRKYADTVGGREQLAINSFADAIEIIPRTLAENAGLDPIDKLVELRAAHDKANGKWMGLDVFKGGVREMYTAGVIEPLKIKTQAIKSASEAAEMILRIDDVISAKEMEGGGAPAGMPPEAMGGMGGMPMM
jgi:thermosome